jgi:hypothetical protein
VAKRTSKLSKLHADEYGSSAMASAGMSIAEDPRSAVGRSLGHLEFGQE